ncbi:MAG: sugar transferase [Bacteroidota bacterium]
MTAKRLFDILISGTALIVLSPVLLMAALAIRLESKGSPVYVSKRVGAGYRVFSLFKLRTMYPDADRRLKDLAHLNQYAAPAETPDAACPACTMNGEACSPLLVNDAGELRCERSVIEARKQGEAGVFFKLQNDPRVTRTGRFLRKTSIDELPQLLNVLRGDMSIVGNRPLPLYEAEQLTRDGAVGRFLAPAGLTGLWQVTKRGTADVSAEERIQLDLDYAASYGFFFDLKLMARTVPALLQTEDV